MLQPQLLLMFEAKDPRSCRRLKKRGAGLDKLADMADLCQSGVQEAL